MIKAPEKSGAFVIHKLKGRLCMKDCVFSRCTYKVMLKGMPTPEDRIYVLRCGCSNFDALDQVVEDNLYNAPDGCETRTTAKTIQHDDMGKSLVIHTIEYIDQSGEVVFAISDLAADSQQYSMEYLLSNPELLPDGDVEGFVAAYKHYDEVKAGLSSR